MKRFPITVLTMLAALTFAASVWAQPMGWPGGPRDNPGPGDESARPPDAPRPQRPRRAARGPEAFPRPDMPRGLMRGPEAGPPGDDVIPLDEEIRHAAAELHPFWRMPRLKEEGKLTEDQVKKLDESFDATRSKLIDLAADLAHKRIALQEAQRADTPDLSKINSAIEAVGKARIEVQKTVAAHRAAVFQTLNAEQREMLKKFREQRPLAWGPVGEGDRPRLDRFREAWQNLPEERQQAILERMKERRASQWNAPDKEGPGEEKEEKGPNE